MLVGWRGLTRELLEAVLEAAHVTDWGGGR
jgi:hypothetical protein